MNTSVNLNLRDLKFASRLERELSILGLHYPVICEADGIWRLENLPNMAICMLKYYGLQNWNIYVYVPGVGDSIGKASSKSFNSASQLPIYSKIVNLVSLEILIMLVKNKCIE